MQICHVNFYRLGFNNIFARKYNQERREMMIAIIYHDVNGKIVTIMMMMTRRRDCDDDLSFRQACNNLLIIKTIKSSRCKNTTIENHTQNIQKKQ